MKWFMILNEFNEISILARIFLAMILGGLIGLEREKSKRPAGFRTHILVCVGACMTALIGFFVWNETGGNNDPMRISAQVISGIGFLGVGTILVKEHDHITAKLVIIVKSTGTDTPIGIAFIHIISTIIPSHNPVWISPKIYPNKGPQNIGLEIIN